VSVEILSREPDGEDHEIITLRVPRHHPDLDQISAPLTPASAETMVANAAEAVPSEYSEDTRVHHECGHRYDEHVPWGCDSDDPQPCWCETPWKDLR
jgi:hypothetical protein